MKHLSENNDSACVRIVVRFHAHTHAPPVCVYCCIALRVFCSQLPMGKLNACIHISHILPFTCESA